jgi:hypothetical protein
MGRGTEECKIPNSTGPRWTGKMSVRGESGLSINKVRSRNGKKGL